MSDYNNTLQFLYDLQLFGIKVGLNNIQALLRFLHNPQDRFPSIHIAGTNGKGSTAAMIASLLTASGYRTGLYTSPHLIHFNERIRIDGKKISDDYIVRYAAQLKPQIEKVKATFFEATTAIAFQYFADQHVDVAVIETGLGGRLDATNVVAPLLSIITNIGLEHTEYLGATYEKIAYEKGGIIKSGVPCLTGSDIPAVVSILRRIAKNKGTELLQASTRSSFKIRESSLEGITVDLTTEKNLYRALFVALAGEHQARNLQLALLAAELLKESRMFPNISSDNIIKGLASLHKFSGWRGRIDVLQKSPLIIADVAHNPDGMKALYIALRKLLVGKVILVFGVMNDKDYSAMMNIFAPLARVTVAVKPQIDRALAGKRIVQEMHTSMRKAINGGDVAHGVEIALNEARNGETILVTGSHYVVGEAMKFLTILS